MLFETKYSIYEFEEFQVDLAKRLISRNGDVVPIQARAFDLLVELIENRDRVSSKHELMASVWGDQIVEDSNLAVQIASLRKLLRERKDNRRFIINIPGKGYRFVADIRESFAGDIRNDDEEIIFDRQKIKHVVVKKEIEEDRENITEGSKVLEHSNASLVTNFAFSHFGKFIPGALLLAGVITVMWFWLLEPKNAEMKQPTFTRLTTSGKVSAIAFAPDGKYFVFSQKESDGESLWVRQIETGSQTNVVPPRQVEYVGLAVSPDGNFVYASVFSENRADTPILKIPILGGSEHHIQNLETSVAVSFEPNGNRIVFTDAGRPETRLRIAKADGSNERILIRAHADRRSFAIWKSNPLAWTPDGTAIAAAFTEKNESGLRSGVILVNPSDGSEQTLIVPRSAYIENVTWLNAENVAFIAYEDDWSNQIWLFSRRNGKTRQLTNGLAKYKWLTSADGTLLAVETRAITSLHTADFDENTQALQTQEIYRESGYISNVAWSKNGAVLYSSRANGKPEIWRIDKDGANASQITSDARINFGLAVSPSDGSIIFCSHRGGKYSIWTADASGKNMRALTDGTDHITPDVSADGKIVFQSLSEQIWRLSPTDEKPVHLLRGLKPVLSPDGRQTAFFMMDEGKWLIGLISTDSGELLKKIDLPTMVNQRRIRWHPNGKFLTMIFKVGDNLKLLLLPTERGNPRIIEGLGNGDVSSFSWSRDGKQLLYSLTDEIQDVVLISNVE